MTDIKKIFSGKTLRSIILVYLALQPVIDIATSFLVYAGANVTAGTVFRALFLVFAGIYLLFFARSGRRAAICWIAAVALYTAAQAAVFFLAGGAGAAMANIKEAVKIFYYPCVLLMFVSLYREHKFYIGDGMLAAIGSAYALTILLSVLTGTSFDTYSSAGYCGWFYAANEIAVIIGALLPSAACFFLSRRAGELCLSKKPAPRAGLIAAGIFSVLLMLFSSVFIGTKALFFTALLYLACTLVWCLINADFRRDRHTLFRSAASLAMCAALFALYLISPVRANITKRMSWFYDRFVVKGEIVSTVTTTAESTAPGETVFTTEADPIPKNQESKLFRTLNWVLSSRLAYSTSINAQFREDMPRSLLFGVGYRQLPSYTYSVQKAVEMDYISVFYRNGALGLILFALPGLWVFFSCIKKAFTKLSACFSSLEWCTSLFQVLIVFLTGFFIGHTMVAPAASIYLICVTVKLMADTDNALKAK